MHNLHPAGKMCIRDRPTIVNNVETLACVPYILRNGADAFAKFGTEKSKGTKVFALGGKINNVGLVEIPMGTTPVSYTHLDVYKRQQEHSSSYISSSSSPRS